MLWTSGVEDSIFAHSLVDVWCDGRLMWWSSVWWMSRVVAGCLVWWMPYFTHGVVDVWCGECPVGVVNTPFLHMVDIWCGGCLVL